MFDRAYQISLRMLAAVLLAAISFHAAAPAKAMEQSRGSAFSVVTVDVAVLCHLRQAEKVAVSSPTPASPPPSCTNYRTLFQSHGDSTLPVLIPWVHAPPPEPIRTRPSQPRSPPSR